MRQRIYLFLSILCFGFVIQLLLRSVYDYWDKFMWANEMQYFLSHDARAFDMYRAYGHPGTTLIELGSLIHILFGVSYVNAVTVGMGLLIAVAVAACVVLATVLYRGSLWWVAIALTLLLNRTWVIDTPPTSIVIPFIVLIILAAWWLWEQHSGTPRQLHFFLWGTVIGLSAATRLDATFLVTLPLFALIWFRHRFRALLPVLAGCVVSFFAADPFLWFAPLRHLTDLMYKFTMSYMNMPQLPLEPARWARTLALTSVSFGFSLVLLWRKRLARIIPIPIYSVILGTTLFGIAIIFASRFQSERYLSPLIITWDILLPLFALETFAPTDRVGGKDSFLKTTPGSSLIICIVLLIQVGVNVLFLFSEFMLGNATFLF